MNDVAANLAKVRATMSVAAERSGRSDEAVRLVLATKTVAPDRILQAIHGGQAALGENKVQEGLRKARALAGHDISWSMIGHLQTNKVRDMLRFALEVQSLDRLGLAVELERRLQAIGRGLDVLVQVNTSGESTKYGLPPADVPAFLRELTAFHALNVRGFMTLAVFSPEEARVRKCFRALRTVRDRARDSAPQGAALSELSMGMSGDFVWAIEEGATIVRIGQAIFGARPLPDSHYWPDAVGAAR